MIIRKRRTGRLGHMVIIELERHEGLLECINHKPYEDPVFSMCFMGFIYGMLFCGVVDYRMEFRLPQAE